VQMLELGFVKVWIGDDAALVHPMSKILGFESNHKPFLVFNLVVAFRKDLESACIRLDHLVPIRKTFVLGKDHTPSCKRFVV